MNDILNKWSCQDLYVPNRSMMSLWGPNCPAREHFIPIFEI